MIYSLFLILASIVVIILIMNFFFPVNGNARTILSVFGMLFSAWLSVSSFVVVSMVTYADKTTANILVFTPDESIALGYLFNVFFFICFIFLVIGVFQIWSEFKIKKNQAGPEWERQSWSVRTKRWN